MNAARNEPENFTCLLRHACHELANDVSLHSAHIDHADKLTIASACNSVMWRRKNSYHLFLGNLIDSHLVTNE